MESPEVTEPAMPSLARQYELELGVTVDTTKLLFEAFKHLTTLSTGSMLLLGTLSSKIAPDGQFLLAFGFIALAIATFSAFMSMLHLAVSIGDDNENEEERKLARKHRSQIFNASVYGFLAGLAFIILSILAFGQT